jgi:hypothetical protein
MCGWTNPGSTCTTSLCSPAARLWAVHGNRPPIVMHGGDYRVIHASISPNGRLVATSTFLHAPPRIWDATNGKLLFSLGRATGTVPDI